MTSSDVEYPSYQGGEEEQGRRARSLPSAADEWEPFVSEDGESALFVFEGEGKAFVTVEADLGGENLFWTAIGCDRKYVRLHLLISESR